MAPERAQPCWVLWLVEQNANRAPDRSHSANAIDELRFSVAGGVWRIAFVFNRNRIGVLLTAAEKAGVKQARFYKALIKLAEKRFSTWE